MNKIYLNKNLKNIKNIKILNFFYYSVNVIKPRIVIRSMDRSEGFQPKSTSTFALSVNEGFGEIVIHEGSNYSTYMDLIHYPLAQDYIAISNVMQSTQIIEDANVTI